MPRNASDLRPAFDHVVIVGVGLIGGSIARAVKQQRVSGQVTGFGRNRERLEAARQAGVIDTVATSVSELKPFSLAVVCTPVDRIVEDVRSLQSVAPGHALLTDAGSVKGRICYELNDLPRFIGSHPMAGSEQGGWEHSRSDLFENKTCAITPHHHHQTIDIEKLESFWNALGMRTLRIAPIRHDNIVALTSHLPHALAAVLASRLTSEAGQLASTGFRDTTRIASGDPELWTTIFRDNSKPVIEALRGLVGHLNEFVDALDGQDWKSIQEMLNTGKQRRDDWLNGRPDLTKD